MTASEDALNLLRDRFLARCRDQLAALKAVAGDGRRLSTATEDAALLKTVHSLAGAGGTFGFPTISARASDLETLLIAQEVHDDAARRALQALIREIEELLPR
ncbi:Hpt domain-containing protein [Aquamicrobium soli]|uniref:Hpt domain-containing protein n=1 Tax=Aquamicrobium soli TaxID=1811518 RepID=A0ABV7KA18_9HYPH